MHMYMLLFKVYKLLVRHTLAPLTFWWFVFENYFELALPSDRALYAYFKSVTARRAHQTTYIGK